MIGWVNTRKKYLSVLSLNKKFKFIDKLLSKNDLFKEPFILITLTTEQWFF